MTFFNLLFFFCFYSSAVLVYGIGLKQVITASKICKFDILIQAVITVLIVTLSILIVWPISMYFLVPFNLQPLIPFFCLLTVLPFSILINITSQKIPSITVADFFISVPCVLLSITESISLSQSLISGFLFLTSYYLLIPVIYAIRKRIEYSEPMKDFNNGSLIFISISILLCAMFATNISWLNFGAFK